MKKLIIAHLYPAEMNIYGDRGNVMALVKRLKWRGHQAEVVEIEPKKSFDFRQADIVFGGGGQDKGQAIVAEDLGKRADNLVAAAASGVVMLTICGTYQLFGRSFTTAEGEEIPGISIFKAFTVGSSKRMIGNVVIQTPFGELVGFENHSGQTTLEPSQGALGQVLKGYGNNEHSKQEGAVHNNAFGTYLHGPLLPKNPQFTDELIRRALERVGVHKLEPLNDTLEQEAAAVAKKRPQ